MFRCWCDQNWNNICDCHGSQDILNNLEAPGNGELDDDDLMLDVDLPEDGFHGQHTYFQMHMHMIVYNSFLKCTFCFYTTVIANSLASVCSSITPLLAVFHL